MKHDKEYLLKNRQIPIFFPAESIVLPELGNLSADPFGSYTGIPEDPEEKPVQDADDL